MVSRDAGISTLPRLVYANAIEPILTRPSGMLISVKDVQPSNILLGILVINLGKVTFLRFVQFLKIVFAVRFPIPSSTTTSSSPVQPAYAEDERVVSFEERTTLLRLVQLAKPLS